MLQNTFLTMIGIIEHRYKTVFIIIFLLAFGELSAQFNLEQTDFLKIPQKKIRCFITAQIQNDVHYISDIKPSCEKGQDISNYWTHEKEYVIKEEINKVWDNYYTLDPREIWNKKALSFGLLLSKRIDRAFYKGDTFESIEVGQIYYLNLKLLRGVYDIAVAFEILTVDKERRIIEFSYINGGIAKGMQTLMFSETNDGKTIITHKSFFKSNSKFRDKFLYPLFHKKFINEFHRNVNLSGRK